MISVSLYQRIEDFNPDIISEGSPSRHLLSLSASYLWTEANHLLASGGSLSEAAIMIEQFITRSTPQERTQINVSLTEAWATLGRVHAMDEKEEKALEAFQAGSKALEQEGITGKEGIAGEMLTVSYIFVPQLELKTKIIIESRDIICQ